MLLASPFPHVVQNSTWVRSEVECYSCELADVLGDDLEDDAVADIWPVGVVRCAVPVVVRNTHAGERWHSINGGITSCSASRAGWWKQYWRYDGNVQLETNPTIFSALRVNAEARKLIQSRCCQQFEASVRTGDRCGEGGALRGWLMFRVVYVNQHPRHVEDKDAVSLDLYQDHLERKFLRTTEQHYKVISAQLVESGSVSDYAKRVRQLVIQGLYGAKLVLY